MAISIINSSLLEIKNSKVTIARNINKGDLIPYPSGYTMDNCVISSVMGYYQQTSAWYDCYMQSNSGLLYPFLQLALRNDGIYCNSRIVDASFTKFKVTLTKC